MSSDGAGPISGSTGVASVIDEPGFAVYPLSWCPHLDLLTQQQDLQVDTKAPCQECGDRKENWICLHCKQILCSRYVNSDMAKHASSTGHVLTLSFSDLSAWCYGCDDYVDNKLLFKFKDAVHRNKFGEPMLNPHSTEEPILLS